MSAGHHGPPPHISLAMGGGSSSRAGPGSPGQLVGVSPSQRSVQFHVSPRTPADADDEKADSGDQRISPADRKQSAKLDRRSLAGVGLDGRLSMDISLLRLPDIDVALAPHEAEQLAKEEQQAAQEELHEQEVVQEVVVQDDTPHALGAEAEAGHAHRVRTHIKTQKVSSMDPVALT